jgi:predicted aspartyl protease
LSEVVGHVDLRNRPLANISISGREDAVLALIDTGFNGHLLMHEDVAEQFGLVMTGAAARVELAGRELRQFSVADGRILWFGELRQVPVLISADESPRRGGPDEPLVLLGTALLNPHKLIVDFERRRVVIAQAD